MTGKLGSNEAAPMTDWAAPPPQQQAVADARLAWQGGWPA